MYMCADNHIYISVVKLKLVKTSPDGCDNLVNIKFHKTYHKIPYLDIK